MSGPVPPSAGGGQDAPALPWFRSSYSSSGDGNDCVEVAIAPGSVHVRDSKAPDGPRLTVRSAAWRRFVSHSSHSARRPGPQGRRHPLLADR
ncbi:DUF397 domain-containing protein [Streptomyces sp. McG7]|uniref:DUF397 domain-containing protein n=1 Tax=Streptomyces sp. McG7 TaxID=2725486 RepID=UPI001BE65AC5|nr:DUF397 domain-containing protein [Streptomyces sp. McG7]